MLHSFGVVGLGVMGANLARNIASRGFSVVGYDLNAEKVTRLTGEPGTSAAPIVGADSLEHLVRQLERPRRILIMVPAGPPVDAVVAQIQPYCALDDILIDGGNSYFKDTDRRSDAAAATGLHFVGAGVSGGEAGALRGPAIMPGGSEHAWKALAPIFRAIAARADDGEPCVAHMGPRGAGHYVKMVHNGIEYADMQLIAEVYDLLSRGAGMSAREIAAVFNGWRQTELRSYLIDITAAALAFDDPETGQSLVDVILDEAQQKGTGKWTSQNSFDLGTPIPTINAAVEARMLSARKGERAKASPLLTGPSASFQGDVKELVNDLRQALYASKVSAYAQGMALLGDASREYGYGIDRQAVASVWRAGCIIRAALLSDIRAAFAEHPALENLFLHESFRAALGERQGAWRRIIATAAQIGIPVPALGASLAYYDAYRSARLPANLTQAQRDFFGAHTYRRVDREGSFHTQWPDA